MLISERKAGESIFIGDEIVIRVLRVRGGRASIAVDAPLHVNVVREELEQNCWQQASEKGISTEKSRKNQVIK
jgi:carbon storage regulator CsrA